jgi:glutaredoxin-like YruB-family protein
MAQQVSVYSTPTCPICKRVKQFLDDNQVPYKNIDVTASKTDLDEMIQKTGQLSVPVTDIDGDLILGYDEKKLKAKLGL